MTLARDSRHTARKILLRGQTLSPNIPASFVEIPTNPPRVRRECRFRAHAAGVDAAVGGAADVALARDAESPGRGHARAREGARRCGCRGQARPAEGGHADDAAARGLRQRALPLAAQDLRRGRQPQPVLSLSPLWAQRSDQWVMVGQADGCVQL